MAFLKYTFLRLLVFAVIAALLYLMGLRQWFLLLPVAIFVSGVFSIFVLNRTRAEASASLSNRLSAIRKRLDEATVAEDEWDDAQRRENSDR